MRVFNRYLLFLITVFCLTNIILAATGQNDLTLYVTLNIIVYFMVTLLNVHFSPRAKRSLNALGMLLFAGYMAIVLIKVMEALAY